GTKVSAVVRDRILSIDEIHSFVVDGIDAALGAWEESARKRALKPTPKTTTRATARRRRTA
ncbi:MAG TPA: hypothetical protein VK636_18480, partial [Gemmatimonadaceae bacterium]|nr:hypothetical protein [Gemmatimonadaceae bacterium]